jgi:glycosyltransferase involved in cell wall biosynthesis
MKVVHIIPTISARHGGPQALIWPLLESVRQQNINVELLTTHADWGHDVVQRHQLPSIQSPIHLQESRAAFQSWLQSSIRSFDLAVVHSIWNRESSIAMATCRFHRVPYIVFTHGMMSPYTWKRRWWKKWPYWWLYDRRNLHQASAIHVTSPGERAEIEAWKFPCPSFEIPPGVEQTAFTTPQKNEDLRSRCQAVAKQTLDERPIVISLGRLHPKKGITDILLPAFRHLKTKAYLAIAGGPEDSVPDYPNEIRAMIRQYGLDDRVFMIGNIPPEEKWNLFDGAAVCVQPSWQENFGLTVTESLSRGCPVIITEGVQSRSIVESVQGGWVVPFRVEAFAKALDSALADLEQTAKIGRLAAIKVQKDLSWDRAGEKMAAMYRQVISKGP